MSRRCADATTLMAGASLLALALQVMSAASPTGQPCTEDAEVVTIEDDGLRQAIQKQLMLATDAVLTCKDMKSLRELTARELNIKSLAGLEHAINLERLDCGRNNLTTLTPLTGLNQLTELRVERNRIRDLEALQDNTTLRTGFRLHIHFNCLDVSDGSSASKAINAFVLRGWQIEYKPNPSEDCPK